MSIALEKKFYLKMTGEETYEVYDTVRKVKFILYQIFRESDCGVRIDEISDSGIISEIPLTLDLKSKFLYFFICNWPPHCTINIHDFYIHELGLYIHYSEIDLSTGVDKRYEWKACFDLQKRVWTLNKIAFTIN